MTRLEQLAHAIACFEGFFVTADGAKARGIPYPTVAQRCNNPGNLMFVGQPGAKPVDIVGADNKLRTYAEFGTEEDGWQALFHLINVDAVRGLTLQQFIQKYAPDADANDPGDYFAFVVKQLNADPAAKLWDVLTGGSAQ